VTTNPEIPGHIEWPRGLTVHHRDELDTVQRELATVPAWACSFTIRPALPEAAPPQARRVSGSRKALCQRLVSEGCGDCGVKSEYVSAAAGTEWAQAHHRPIDCSKDYSV
jgi:indolepyruvate ferredoxin oxidoreductase